MKLYLPIAIDLFNPYPLAVMNAQQYNTGRGALVTLTAGGSVIVPEVESLYIYAKKPDGTIVYANCSLVGNQIQVDYDEQMLIEAGMLQMELQMVDGEGNSITTPIYMINVQPSNMDYKKITSQDEFLALVSALAEVNELKKNGLKGDPGEAATLQIGTVTASAPGSDPVVTNSGTEQNAVLNFIIPRGEEGPTGPPISTVNPAEATEEDTGEAADAYFTKQMVGDLTQLQTTDKSSIVAAVNEQNVKINKNNITYYYTSKTTFITSSWSQGSGGFSWAVPVSGWYFVSAEFIKNTESEELQNEYRPYIKAKNQGALVGQTYYRFNSMTLVTLNTIVHLNKDDILYPSVHVEKAGLIFDTSLYVVRLMED